MKVGIISPIRLLSKYCTTNIQYVIPSLYSESKEYRNFYDRKVEKGDMVILDCKKVGWKREPEDLSLCIDVAKFLSPYLIILPSCMYNCIATLEVANRYANEFKGMNLVGCLEGTTIKEIKRCMRGIRKADMVAIPSHIYNICTKIDDKQVIYLDNHLRIEELEGLDGILVTSLPIRLGLLGRLLSDYLPSPPSLTFYEEEDLFPMIVESNVKEVLDYYESWV